jgi:virginiamycin B lyase
VRSHAKASSAGSTTRGARGFGRLAAAALTLVATLLLALTPTALAAPSRSYSTSFGTFSGSNPLALTVDQSSGDLYVLNSNVGEGTVYRFAPDGSPDNFTAGTNVGTNTLTGLTFGLVGEGEAAVDNSGGPADGALYVTNVDGSLKVYASDGSSLGTLTGTGTAAGSFASACGVAVDQATGDLYVADSAANRIWRYSPSGSTVAESDYSGGIETSFAPCQIAADSGNVYAAPQGVAGGNLIRFRAERFATGTPPAPSGAVIDATTRAVSVNPLNGDVYADKGNQIAVYQSGIAAGDLPYYTFGAEADFGTTSPGVAVKAGGSAYVADRHTGGKQVDVYGLQAPGPSRSYSTSFGTFSGSNPLALTVDQSSGDLYVLNSNVGEGTVYRFAPDGSPDNFTAGTNVGTNTLTGLTFGLVGEGEAAVDNSGGPADGALYVTNVDGSLKVYASDGSSLGTLTGTGTAAGSFASACGVAVDQATGDLYVADSAANRIWRYSPSGSTVAESDYSGGIETSFAPCQIAADSGNVYAAPQGVAGGNLIRFRAERFATGTPPAPSGAVIDATTRAVSVNPLNGDVYADKGNQIAVYQSGIAAGDLPYYTFGAEADFGTTSPGVAVKAGGSAYVADRHTGGKQVDVYGVEVTGFPLTVQKSGTGIGTVISSPAGIDCGLTCVATLGGTVTLTATPGPNSSFKGWSGCGSVVANQCTVTMSSAKSVTASFSSTPLISAPEATQVGSGSATLKAQLNPGGEPTSWHFEYTDDADFQTNGFANATKKPAPDSAAGSGTVNVPVSVALVGLEPGATYHFRLVAINPLGSTEGPDTTFTTYAATPSFPPCENDALRTGAGSGLPDCRAYEQATPVNKDGSDVTGTLPSAYASVNGDAVAFNVIGGTPGADSFFALHTFIARRGTTNWSTQGLFPPPSFGDRTFLDDWTPDLTHVFSVVSSTAAANPGWSFVDKNTTTGTYTLVHSFLANKSGQSHMIGASADASLVYFTNPKNTVTLDAAPGTYNLFVWDRDTNAISLVGKVPTSPEVSCDGSGPACIVPAGGSSLGIVPKPGEVDSGFSQQEHAVSTSGDQVVFNASSTGLPTDGPLYARLDAAAPNASTVEVSASQRTDCADHDPCSGTPEPDPVGTAPATFQHATPSGSKVFFTSSEELTDDSNTGPVVDVWQAGIGHADLSNGGDSDLNAIAPQDAEDVAIHGSHIYWTDPTHDRIGRAEIDSNGNPVGVVEPNFITGADDPEGIAFHPDSDGAGADQDYLFWTNGADHANGTGTIARATLDGSGAVVAGSVNESLITGASDPNGIDTNATDIYWANAGTSHLGRANIDGSNPEPNLLTGIGVVDCCAKGDIAVNGSYLYYSFTSGGTIIRRVSIALDGSGFSNVVIPPSPPAGQWSGDEPVSFAIDGSHLYYTDINTGTIGRSDLDGSNDNPNFITHAGRPNGVTIDASHVFWSTLAPATNAANPGKDLYSWDSASRQLTDLTPESADPNGAEVQGVIGVSDDGDYVYFVANGDLDGAGPASTGNCHLANALFPYSATGQCSIYLWHAGDAHPTFVAPVAPNAEPYGGDGSNWVLSGAPQCDCGHLLKTGRVSADGHSVFFSTALKLTDYDNQGKREFYRYNISEGLSCVTCNPTGAPPNADATLSSVRPPSSAPKLQVHGYPLSLSSDGSRVFFESPDKLVAADGNGLRDVYEWEAPGSGSCSEASPAYYSQDGGCLYLISTGTSSSPSFFGGASSSGDDIFFYTRDQLVPQDTDQLVDVYDASVDGGLPAQHAAPPPNCSGEACRGPSSSAAGAAGAGSAVFSGPGNEKQSTLRNCGRGVSRAKKLARKSKQLRRQARKAKDAGQARHLRQESAALAKKAHKLSQSAKRCRKANRRAAR